MHKTGGLFIYRSFGDTYHDSVGAANGLILYRAVVQPYRAGWSIPGKPPERTPPCRGAEESRHAAAAVGEEPAFCPNPACTRPQERCLTGSGCGNRLLNEILLLVSETKLGPPQPG